MDRRFHHHRLLDFISEVRYSDLPGRVADKAALCILDTLAAIIAGLRTPVSSIAADYARSAWKAGSSTVLANGDRCAAIGAAFANAVAANGTDIDDCGRYTWGHPGAQVLPTALALAEEQRASGAELVVSVVIGYELAFRSGRCLNYGDNGPPVSSTREFRACGSWGAAACAAISAHLRHLPREQIANALGIAEYHSPHAPLMRNMAAPAMVKHAIGIGPVTGIMAAELAARGFTGMPSGLLADKYVPWTGDAGNKYLLPTSIQWKRFSCCAWSHAALLAAERLRARYCDLASRVREIEVESYSDAVNHLGIGIPDTSEQAQFSMSWPIAVMLLDGEVHPRSMLPQRITDKATRELAAKIRVRENPELTRLYLLSESNNPSGREASIVRLKLDDGTVVDSGLADLDPYEEPASCRKVIEDKFRWVTADLLPSQKVEAVIRLSRDLPGVNDVADLVDIVAVN
jgi:2-methylcitrate dehydratase PrpD